MRNRHCFLVNCLSSGPAAEDAADQSYLLEKGQKPKSFCNKVNGTDHPLISLRIKYAWNARDGCVKWPGKGRNARGVETQAKEEAEEQLRQRPSNINVLIIVVVKMITKLVSLHNYTDRQTIDIPRAASVNQPASQSVSPPS